MAGRSGEALFFDHDPAGQLIGLLYNGARYCYLRNGQGDITGIVDGSGTTVVQYTYSTWGELLSVTGSMAATLGQRNPFRYRGYYFDPETGLYYLKTRYYDPETCRFISADLYLSTGQGVLGYNGFAYCGNGPCSRADDSGEFWNIVVGALAGAALSGIAAIAANAASGSEWNDGLGIALLTGAASGALAASGVGLVTSVVGNAAISMAGNAAGQFMDSGGKEFDVADMILDGIIGGIGGWLGGEGMGKSVNYKTLNNSLTNKLLSGSPNKLAKAIKYCLSQTASGYKEFLGKPLDKAFNYTAPLIIFKKAWQAYGRAT